MTDTPAVRLNADPRLKRWSVETRWKDRLSVCNTYDTLDRALSEVTRRAGDDFIESIEVRPSW